MKNEFVFMANILDSEMQKNYELFLGKKLGNDTFKPMFLEFGDSTSGMLVQLDIFPEDCVQKSGIIKARQQFLQALKYAKQNFDVKIVLLAASTKRLFGKEIELKVNFDGNLDDSGCTLRELYPEIIFTNGDNGTAAILNMEIDAVMHKISHAERSEASSKTLDSSPSAQNDNFDGTVIINGLGLLGMDSLEYLLEKNLRDEQIIIISNHTKDLKEVLSEKEIKVFPTIKSIEIDDIDKIRTIVNCTHNPASLITAENLKQIQNGQKIHVIDVAVPYGFPEEEFLKCKNVERQDGGNAFIETGLEFFFNPEICGLTENVLYGCFAETVALSAFLKGNPDEIANIRQLDLFNVNSKSKQLVKSLFEKYGIGISPEPFNFNKRKSVKRK